MRTPRTLDEAKERFWSRVDRRAPSECWPWMGPMRKDGYGTAAPPRCLVRGRTWVNAARVAWCFAWEAVPIGKRIAVRHDCDYRRCCNPLHLRLGSPASNNADIRLRFRSPAQRAMARKWWRNAVYEMGWAAVTQMYEQPVGDAAMTWGGRKLASLRGRAVLEHGIGAGHGRHLDTHREERIAMHTKRIAQCLEEMGPQRRKPWERGPHPMLKKNASNRTVESHIFKRLRKSAPANRYYFTPHATLLAAVAKLMAG